MRSARLISIAGHPFVTAMAMAAGSAARFEKAIYVLHCFQKKSPSGVRTARQDIGLIHERLRTALRDYEVRYAKQED